MQQSHSELGVNGSESYISNTSISIADSGKGITKKRKRLRLSDGETQKLPKKKAKQSSSPKQNAGEAEGGQFQRQDKDLETLQEKRFDVLQNKGSVSNNSLLDEEGNIIENSSHSDTLDIRRNVALVPFDQGKCSEAWQFHGESQRQENDPSKNSSGGELSDSSDFSDGESDIDESLEEAMNTEDAFDNPISYAIKKGCKLKM